MENNTQNENTFTKGLFIKMPPTTAPDFVLLNISVKPQEFFKWCQEHLTEDSRGWVNIQIKRSKDGSKIYGQLDNFKPKTNPEQTHAYNDNKYKTSPSPEFPNGVDAYNHVLTTDKEREVMDKELDAMMGDIPF